MPTLHLSGTGGLEFPPPPGGLETAAGVAGRAPDTPTVPDVVPPVESPNPA